MTARLPLHPTHGPTSPAAIAHRLGSVPAVSIHVYAPSLDRMTFFGDDPRDDLIVAGTQLEAQP